MWSQALNLGNAGYRGCSYRALCKELCGGDVHGTWAGQAFHRKLCRFSGETFAER